MTLGELQRRAESVVENPYQSADDVARACIRLVGIIEAMQHSRDWPRRFYDEAVHALKELG